MKLSDLGLDVNNMTIDYQCCFCKEGVSGNEVCGLTVTINWGEGEKKDQLFFCHGTCFEKATKEKIEVYDEDDPRFKEH